MNAPPPAVIDPWGAPSAAGGGAADNMATMDNTNLILWRERERRQRSVRTLMMFLLMLLLMDGEEGNGNNSQHNRNRDRLRKRKFQKSSTSLVAVQPLERDVFDARQTQEATLRSLVQGHPRYHHLVAKNGGSNVEQQVLQWTERLDAMVKDQFGQEEEQRGSVLAASPTSLAEEMVLENENNINNNNNDPSSEILAMDATTKVFHYPWNATGFYRGQWKRHHRNSKKDKTATTTKSPRENEADYNNNNNTAPLPATALEESLLQTLHQRREIAGVYLLPRGQEIALRNDNNLTTLQYERMTLDATGKVYPPPAAAAMPGSVLERHPPTATSSSSATTAASDSSSRSRSRSSSTITLTMDSGRAAFQFYSRSIPGMRELSLVDGFVKLYDSSSPGYSTRQDVLLRVRGVLIHAIGRLSLVSSAAASGGGGGASSQRSALVMGNGLQLVNDEKATSGASGEEGTKTKTGSITAATTRHRRRRLQEALSNIKQYHNDDNEAENMKVQMDTIRRHAMALYGTPEDSAHDELFSSTKTSGAGFAIQSPELLLHQRRLDVVEEEEEVDAVSLVDATEPEQTGEEEEDAQSSTTAYASAAVAQQRRVAETDPKEDHTNNKKKKKKKNHLIPPWSDVVIPYPFVRDDADETIRKVRTPAARRMPVREQMLESNAGSCEFEINLNVQELEWTVGAWRKLLTHKLVETKKLNPYVNSNNNNKEDSSGGGVGGTRPDSEVANEVHLVGVSSTDSMPGAPSRSKKFVPDQALVMKLVGTIESRNCDFSATLNATALRTDWDATTNKAINYSFYMMLVCLTQIIILLRQLLHSQAQSAATRVSIVCIGWQTVVDALICLGHIYLSLAMQPLFTAFASVAFFKLLIFCVIEMKYMAIIIQARNSANGGQPTEVLRRQVAVLHLRIYVALFGTFILLFYVGDTHRTIAMVTLYSFWVPQIILNVVTEARTPMHKYYIYGMSFTRMIAPLYVFCIRNNFLKEVYPDAPHDPDMCLVLVLWMALQTAVLMAQSKYGARFMIPARFLPPKFDYSRPLPVSMLPPGTTAASMAEMHSSDPSDERSSSLSPPHDRSRHTTADTTRKRTKKGNRGKTSSHFEDGETAEMNSGIDNNCRGPASPITASSSRLPRAPAPTLDCSICYEPINIRDRQGYMLAPCEHLYHRDCLVRWMDIKMECPTCRTELPPL